MGRKIISVTLAIAGLIVLAWFLFFHFAPEEKRAAPVAPAAPDVAPVAQDDTAIPALNEKINTLESRLEELNTSFKSELESKLEGLNASFKDLQEALERPATAREVPLDADKIAEFEERLDAIDEKLTMIERTLEHAAVTDAQQWQMWAAGVCRTMSTAIEIFKMKFGDYPDSETADRGATGNDRLLFDKTDDSRSLPGNQDCPTASPVVARTYTFIYTRIDAFRWTLTADTNQAGLQDFYVDQSCVLRAAPSKGDGCQAGPTSNPFGG